MVRTVPDLDWSMLRRNVQNKKVKMTHDGDKIPGNRRMRKKTAS